MIIAAFLLSPVVLLLGFFLGSMLSSTRIADLQARCEWLSQMLWEQEMIEYGEVEDAEDLVWRFQQQIDDLDIRDSE